MNWLVLATFLMAVVQLGMAYSPTEYLYFWVIPLGFSYGGMFCLLPTLVSTVYGLPNFAANWGFMQFGPTIGAFMFSSGLASVLSGHFQEMGQWIMLEDVKVPGEVCSFRTRANARLRRGCLGH